MLFYTPNEDLSQIRFREKIGKFHNIDIIKQAAAVRGGQLLPAMLLCVNLYPARTGVSQGVLP